MYLGVFGPELPALSRVTLSYYVTAHSLRGCDNKRPLSMPLEMNIFPVVSASDCA